MLKDCTGENAKIPLDKIKAKKIRSGDTIIVYSAFANSVFHAKPPSPGGSGSGEREGVSWGRWGGGG